MKKLIIIILLSFLVQLYLLQDPGSKKESKDTASEGVKAATKFDIGKKWVSKAKKLEKKVKKIKQKNL